MYTIVIVDPYSPWTTQANSFRVNNINHREFAVNANDHPYKVIVSTNSAQSDLVDMEVIDGSTNESIKKFTAVDSHFDKDGLMVSSIDSKTLKSNVVLHDQDVVVFDEVKIIEVVCLLTDCVLTRYLVWSHHIQVANTKLHFG